MERCLVILWHEHAVDECETKGLLSEIGIDDTLILAGNVINVCPVNALPKFDLDVVHVLHVVVTLDLIVVANDAVEICDSQIRDLLLICVVKVLILTLLSNKRC